MTDEPDMPAGDDRGISDETFEPDDHPAVQVRRVGGEWEQIPSRRADTGDDELDALWSLSLDELEAILRNPQDSRHERASQVAREMLQPLRNAANVIFAPQAEQFRLDLVRIATSLTSSASSRGEAEAWMKEIHPMDVAPAPDVDVFEVRTNTSAINVVAAADALTSVMEEQRKAQQEADERARADRKEEREEERRRHRTSVIIGIAGLALALVSICVATGLGVSPSPPSRTNPAACGEIPAAWQKYEIVAGRTGRSDATLLAARAEMLATWTRSASTAPEWTAQTVYAARASFEAAVRGDLVTSESAASYAAARSFLLTLVEACQSEGNLPSDYDFR